MDIFGSFFRRRKPVDTNAEMQRKQEEAYSRIRRVGLPFAKVPPNNPITKLEFRRGRLVATTTSGMSHIIPDEKAKPE